MISSTTIIIDLLLLFPRALVFAVLEYDNFSPLNSFDNGLQIETLHQILYHDNCALFHNNTFYLIMDHIELM